METATLELVGPAPASAATTASTIPATISAEHPTAAAEAPAAPPPADTWTIAPGDHLWAVAAETLADHWGRPPSDREIAPYWRTLVDVNRDRLVDRDHPDLVLPGQVFVLPPTPPPPNR